MATAVGASLDNLLSMLYPRAAGPIVFLVTG